MKDKFNHHGSAKWMWVHMKVQLVSFVVQGLISSIKLLEFMSKAVNLLSIELVGQCRNALPLAFSALTSPRAILVIF